MKDFYAERTTGNSMTTDIVTLSALMRKVYVRMALALSITGVTAWGVASSPSLLALVFGTPGVLLGLIVAELVLVLGLSAAINRLSAVQATLLFVLYAVVNGAVLASVFLAYTATSVAQVFFITAGTFAGMAFYGYTTKSDLTSWGKYLFMALFGLILASVVNFFMHSDGLSSIISYAGVLIFVGLTAYDTQKIKRMLDRPENDMETAEKIALLGALTLYLDFINLFLHLLRILGRRR
ncbi:MAG: Bax inhibitor-1/YccA family protein [Prevotellaceae bacterium]|nr:Bax inhibitor-1/YccA family protein [Prevotellaceae bacterium]